MQTMLTNYIRTALRNLMKYRFYSGINILGLATGLTCFLFILIYVKDELSFDRYHERSERILWNLKRNSRKRSDLMSEERSSDIWALRTKILSSRATGSPFLCFP